MKTASGAYEIKNPLISLILITVLLSSFYVTSSFYHTPVNAQTNNDVVCLVYFTFTDCGNCKFTDPEVLEVWPDKYGNLVIIEYMFEDWSESNAFLLSQYAQTYKSTSAVPQLFVSEDYTALGRINVLNVENRVKSATSNQCLLLIDDTDFKDLDLNNIPGRPLKLWANGRLLTRTAVGSGVLDDFLRELLFTQDIEETIDSYGYGVEETGPEPAPIAYGQIEFSNMLNIEDAWTFSYNDNAPTTTTSPGSTQPTAPTTSTTSSGEDANIIEITIFGIDFGNIDISKLSLPALTVIIGLLDGFNPCAMFILCFLLVFLIGTKSRKKVFIIGGIFLFISGFVYFLFITAWFNFFTIFRYVPVLKLIVGSLVIIAGLINIKDYFYFQKGISFTLPKSWKPKVMDRMRKMASLPSLPAMVLGVITIAFVVNIVELMCTIGFPMIYTQILATHSLPQTTYYLYILIYCIMYMIDDFLLFSVAVATLDCIEMTQKRVRMMKLISGTLMVLLAIWFMLS
jgi:hypothetical protein